MSDLTGSFSITTSKKSLFDQSPWVNSTKRNTVSANQYPVETQRNSFDVVISTQKQTFSKDRTDSQMQPFLQSLYNSYNNTQSDFSSSDKTGVSNSRSQSATPAEFVRSILEPAKSAAQLLGTSAEVIIAFAALETGWGKHIIERPDGTSSNNLFGIKSHSQEDKISGAVTAKTTEYINNTPIKLNQSFRSYASRSDSVADFADFLQTNPRYRTALASSQDGYKFVELVHKAGYATDPDYAAKVRSLVTKVATIAESLQSSQSVVPLIDLNNMD